MTMAAMMKAFWNSKATYASTAKYVDEMLGNMPTLTSVRSRQDPLHSLGAFLTFISRQR